MTKPIAPVLNDAECDVLTLQTLRSFDDSQPMELIDDAWCRALIRAGYAAAQSEPQGVPVAWLRYMPATGQFAAASFTDSQAVAAGWLTGPWSVVPLYAAPPATPDRVSGEQPEYHAGRCYQTGERCRFLRPCKGKCERGEESLSREDTSVEIIKTLHGRISELEHAYEQLRTASPPAPAVSSPAAGEPIKCVEADCGEPSCMPDSEYCEFHARLEAGKQLLRDLAPPTPDDGRSRSDAEYQWPGRDFDSVMLRMFGGKLGAEISFVFTGAELNQAGKVIRERFALATKVIEAARECRDATEVARKPGTTGSTCRLIRAESELDTALADFDRAKTGGGE